jgi:uncharacterized phage protein (TIGR01671 family)
MGCDYMNQYMCKAKRRDSGKWVCGYYVMKEDVIFKTKLHYILCQLEGDSLASWYPVDPDTLCRCTGIEDKKGTMIFENDIVEAWSEGYCARGTVYKRIDGLWIMYPAHQNGEFWGLCPDGFAQSTVEIVGNVYDNPDEWHSLCRDDF